MTEVVTKYFQGKCQWAKVQKAEQGTYDDQPMYSIDVALLSKEFEKLKDEGLIDKRKKLKHDSEGNTYIQFKRKTRAKDGNTIPGPRVIDGNKDPYTGLIGNGSLVKVRVDFVPFSFGNISGHSARLQTIQVLKLVEYKGGDPLDGFDVVDDAAADVI